MRRCARCAVAWFALLAVAPGTAVAATPTVSVPALACRPNAFQPAVPCTLQLVAPGDRLLAPGLILFGQTPILPDSTGAFAYEPFGPDDFAFDRVNVFWHAQQHLARLARYGLDPEEKPVLLHVEPGAGSFTNYLEPITTIGTGIGTQDRGAKDSDIIIHEITHAVFNPRLPLGTYTLDKGEATPLLEGLADYFSAAVNGDTRIGEFAKPPNGYHDIASDPAVYHYSRWDVLPPDPYSRGRVLNGALLEIRQAIGETADELVFAATDYAPLRCFTCFADAMRSADADRHAGANRAVIDEAFARRGIGTGPPVVRPLTAPSWGWIGDEVVVRMQYQCGLGPFRKEWWLRHPDGTSELIPTQDDSLRLTLPGPVVVQAILIDRDNVPYAAPPCSLRAYDPSSPDLRVTGIRLSGPRELEVGKFAEYRYELIGGRGVPPTTVTWGGWDVVVSPFPGGAQVRALAEQCQLLVRYGDSIGQLVADSMTIVGLSALAISPIVGATALQNGEPSWYRVTAVGGIAPYRYSWTQIESGVERPLADSSSVLSLQASRDFTLRVRVRDARDTVRTAQIGVRTSPLLYIHSLEAPSVLEAGKSGRFRIRTSGGLTPYHYRWNQQGPSGSFLLADSVEVSSRPVDSDFFVSVQVSDGRGSSESASHQVRVFTPPPPPPPPPSAVRTFKVLNSVLRRGGPAEFELPTPDAAGQLEVLDATGRIRASVALSASPPPTLSLPLPSDLHSGIYFVRLRRSDGTWKGRFVLLTR